MWDFLKKYYNTINTNSLYDKYLEAEKDLLIENSYFDPLKSLLENVTKLVARKVNYRSDDYSLGKYIHKYAWKNKNKPNDFLPILYKANISREELDKLEFLTDNERLRTAHYAVSLHKSFDEGIEDFRLVFIYIKKLFEYYFDDKDIPEFNSKYYYDKKEENEKKKIVEKKVEVVKKEIVTVEKPVVKEVYKEIDPSMYNKDYMEITLLNENNNKGIFYNALVVNNYSIIAESFKSKIEHNIAFNSEELDLINQKLDKLFDYIKYTLYEIELDEYFEYDYIINYLYQENLENESTLFFKYLSDTKKLKCSNEKICKIIENLFRNNTNNIEKLFVLYKDKIEHTDLLRKTISSCLPDSRFFNYLCVFEYESVLEELTFKEFEEKYNRSISEDTLKHMKKYKWGQNLIVIEYIRNNDKRIPDYIFKECYSKINTSEIDNDILESGDLNVIKRLEKLDINFVDKIYQTIDNNNFYRVHRDILIYFLKKDRFENIQFINGLFIYSFKEYDYELLELLYLKASPNALDNIDLDNKILDSKIESYENIKLFKKIYDKFGVIPNKTLNSCINYDIIKTCELFYDYIINNLSIFNKTYQALTYYNRTENKRFYSRSNVIKVLTYFANNISDKNILKSLLLSGLKNFSSSDYIDQITYELIKIINSKGIYIKDLYQEYNSFFKNKNNITFDYEDVFKDDDMFDNLSESYRIPIFTDLFINQNINSKYLDIIIKNSESASNKTHYRSHYNTFLKLLLYKNKYKLFEELVADGSINFDKYEYGCVIDLISYYINNSKEGINNKLIILLIAELKKCLKANQYIEIFNSNTINDMNLLDYLLINNEKYKDVLYYIQNHFNMKEMFGNYLNIKPKNKNEIIKKLFIDHDYYNDINNCKELLFLDYDIIKSLNLNKTATDNIKATIISNESNSVKSISNKLSVDPNYFDDISKYEELLQLDVQKINKLNVKSDSLIKIYDYLRSNDLVGRKKMLSIDDIKLKEHIKSLKDDDEPTVEKRKSTKQKKKKKGYDFIENLFYIPMFFAAFVLMGIVSYAFSFKVDFVEILTLKIFLYFIVSYVIFKTIYSFCYRNYYSLIILTPTIPFLTIVVFYIVGVNKFYDSFEITSLEYSDTCTVVKVKGTYFSETHVNFDDIYYGNKALFVGNHKTYTGNINYKPTYTGDSVSPSNLSEIIEYCNITVPIDPERYEFVSGYYKDGVSSAELVDEATFTTDEETTLVFKSTVKEDKLYFNGLEIKYSENVTKSQMPTNYKKMLSFRDSSDNLLMTGEIIDSAEYKVIDNVPTLVLTINDTDTFFKVTDEISKSNDQLLILWYNFNSSNSFRKNKDECGILSYNSCIMNISVSSGQNGKTVNITNTDKETVDYISELLKDRKQDDKVSED